SAVRALLSSPGSAFKPACGEGLFGREAPPIPPRPPQKAKPLTALGESHGQSRPAILPDGSASSPSPNPPFFFCIRNARRSWDTVSVGARGAAALRGKPRVAGGRRVKLAPLPPPRPSDALSRRLLASQRWWGSSPSSQRPLGKMRPQQLLPRLLLVASAACLGLVGGLFLFGEPEFSYKRSNCKPIPASLLLCRGIEYPDMRLPNLLGHETLQEVLEQAGAWIPLVQKRCHPDTRKFLCSLFAPVCIVDLDETIEPCHSLCEQVKNSCAPVMSAFGFPWPDMLDCS
ncbi:Secreted frizzled-related protein 2, partial [Ophiophagus hannah]